MQNKRDNKPVLPKDQRTGVPNSGTIKADGITFPIAAAALAELQAANLGRELRQAERELFAEIAAVANEAYEAATRGDADTVADILAAIDKATTPDDHTRHVAALCRGWVMLGCARGMENLKQAIDGIS